MLEESSNQLIHVTFPYLRQLLYIGSIVFSKKDRYEQVFSFFSPTNGRKHSVGWIAVHRWETRTRHLLGVLPHSNGKKIKAKQVLDLDSVNHVKLNLAELLTWTNLLLTVQHMLPSPEGCLKRTRTTAAIVESSGILSTVPWSFQSWES